MVQLLIVFKINGQAIYKIGKPKSNQAGVYLPFSITSPSKTVYSDTGFKVVHIQQQTQRVCSYRLRIVKDSSGLTVEAQDSLVQDSLLFIKLLSKDSITEKPVVTLIMVASGDLHSELPIDDIYIPPASIATAVIPPTISLPLDSLKKEKPVKINGSVMVIGQYADNRYPNQSIPQSFVRTAINANVEVFGLPVSTSYYYTTENINGSYQINNFRMSFRYDQFQSNIKAKLNKRAELNKINQLKHFTNLDINSLNAEYEKLRNEINSKDFKKRLEKNLAVIEKKVPDTLLKKPNLNDSKDLIQKKRSDIQARLNNPELTRNFSYKKALISQNELLGKLERLQQIEELKNEYLKYNKQVEMNARLSEVDLKNPKSYMKAAKRYGYVKPGQGIFMSMRKLDIGTFDPDYTVLVLSGVSLMGFNIEVNPGKIYGAFTVGKAVTNFNYLNYLNAVSALTGGRNIISARAGLGSKDNFLCAVSVLRGTDNTQDPVKDSTTIYYQPNYNYVLGIDARYKINSNVDLGVEYAKSQDQAIVSESKNAGDRIAGLANSSQALYSSAWNAYSNIGFNKNTSRIKVSGRWVDPFYNSFGTPYLRKDNFRMEAKGEQLFWKRQLSTSVTYRRDADNLRDTKQGTSINRSMIFNLQLRLKKMPYLLLTYSPNYQSFYNSVFDKNIQTDVKYYNAVLGYTYQKDKTVFNTTLTYSRQFNHTNQTQWKHFDVSQYSIIQSMLVQPVNLTMTGTLNYVLPANGSDTGQLVNLSLTGSKGVFKNKITVTAGARYQDDKMIEQRWIGEAGSSFSLGFGIRCQLHYERHFISSYKNNSGKSDMNLGRVTLIKTF